MRVKLNDQFTGALLGLMTGDALGRSAKGRASEELLEREGLYKRLVSMQSALSRIVAVAG